jgi:purine-binding chemotaxis protein CheW
MDELIDDNKWQDIYRRLARANEKPARGITLTPHARRQILEERARQLARVEITGQEKESPLEVVEFRLADETYALECRHTREVSPLKAPVAIPGAPDFVLGIINIRGQIVSVIDLAKFFELPAKGVNDRAWVIVLENETMEFGVLAEEVLGATSIPAGEIQPPPPTLTGIRAEYLKGIAKNRLIVLDAAKLLADEKIVINQELEI